MVTFRTFRTLSGRDHVDEWYRGLSDTIRGDFRAALDDLAATPEAQWDRPHYGHLAGKDWRGFHELVFKVNAQHMRLIGYWGPARHEFTIVLLHNKNKQGKLTSHQSMIARTNRQVVDRDPLRARIWLHG